MKRTQLVPFFKFKYKTKVLYLERNSKNFRVKLRKKKTSESTGCYVKEARTVMSSRR